MTGIRIAAHLSLPLDWMTLATVVYGARGSGKTTLGSVIAEEVTRAKQRFCAVDLKGDWYGLKSTADGKGEGIPVVVFGGDHADVPLEPDAGAFVAETVAGLGQSCILDFEYFSKGKQVRFLAAFFETLYDRNRDPLLLLLDEAQRYAPQKPIDPDAAKCLGAVEDIVKLGRKHGIGPCLFTQRGSGLNKEVSELCDMMVAFRTPGPLDQDRVKGWLEANVTKAQMQEVMGSLSGLPTGTAVFASGHPDLKVFGTYAVRQRETFDSSATPKVGHRKVEPKKLAQPDLEALRTKMAAAIERQKADDPKALRSRIRELEAALSKSANIDKAPVVETKIVEKPVPVLTAKGRATLERLATDLGKFDANVDEWHKKAVFVMDEVMSALSAGAPTENKTLVGTRVGAPAVRAGVRVAANAAGGAGASAEEHPRGATITGPAATRRRGTDRSAVPPTPARTTDLGKGERKILVAIAQHVGGVTREQLTVLTGYKRSSRDTYLQRLRAAGYLSESGTDDLIFPSPEGVTALGDDYQPLPTGDALRDYWLGRLGGGEAAILAAVLGQYPDSVTREQISEMVDYKRSSRDTYLQRLLSRKLVTIRGGQVRAADMLFSEVA